VFTPSLTPTTFEQQTALYMVEHWKVMLMQSVVKLLREMVVAHYFDVAVRTSHPIPSHPISPATK
jgi:hypothetical protein